MNFPDQERGKAPNAVWSWILLLAAALVFTFALGMIALFLGHPEYSLQSRSVKALLVVQILGFALLFFAKRRWDRVTRRIGRIRFGRWQEAGAGLCAIGLGPLSALVVAPERAAELLGPLVTTVTGRAILLALALGAIGYIMRSATLLAHDEAVRAGRLEHGPPAEPAPTTGRTSTA